MELDAALLFLPINMKNFPAKLWRLVNDPHTDSVRWDAQGEGILIDRPLFEAEVLSAARGAGDTGGDRDLLFKTSNFASFIRQLNLYGFKKSGSRQDDEPDSAAEHHFQNPYFKRDQPALLAHLRRMTRSNKAKLQAGLEVSCRPPSRWQLQFSAPVCRGHTSPKLGGQFHQESHSITLTGETSQGLQQMPFDQTHLAHRQKYNFRPHHLHYPPGFYASGTCQCCCQPFSTDGTRRIHPPSSTFSYYSYSQANYPENWLHPDSQHWPSSEVELNKKDDISLDPGFQVVEDLLVPPVVCVTKVQTPEFYSVLNLSPSSPTQPDSTQPAGSSTLPLCMASTNVSPYGLVPIGGISTSVLENLAPNTVFATIHPDGLH